MIKKVEQNTELRAAGVILLCIYYALACIYIPISVYVNMNDWLLSVLSLGVCVLSAVALAKAARTFHAVISYSLIIAIFIFFGGSLLPVGIFAAFASATCIYAYLLLKHPSPFLWGLPAIPFIVGLLLSKGALCAVLSLCTLPASLLLAYSLKKRLERVSAVCHISFGICAVIVIGFLAAVYGRSGELTVSSAKELIDAARTQLSAILSSTATQMSDMVGFELSESDVASYVANITDTLFNLLPAIAVTLGNIAAYIIHSMCLGICFSAEEDKDSVRPMLVYDMSVVSAIVFIIALVLSFALSTDSLYMYGTVAENIMVILCPGLILVALGALRMLTSRKGPSCLGTLAYMLVIFMLASLSPFAIIGTALAGAVAVIFVNVAKAKSQNGEKK